VPEMSYFNGFARLHFGLGLFVVILRSDKATGAQGRNTFVLLGCERSEKYRKYRTNLEVSITSTGKCETTGTNHT